MSIKTQTALFYLHCLDDRIKEKIILDRKKILLGSSERCDFVLKDGSVSSIHAFLMMTDEGIVIKDLCSESGVYVNSHKIESAMVFAGDSLSIGTLCFRVESEATSERLEDPDHLVKKLAVAPLFELPQKEGLVFIDGEYCDIKFDDSSFEPLSEIPKAQTFGDYIALDESEEVLDLVHSVKDKRLEVISYVNGLLMDVSYLNLKNGDYFLSPKRQKKSDILFHSLNRSKIFTIKEGVLKFHVIESLIPSSPWDQIQLSDAVFFSSGTEQISFRLVEKSHQLGALPAFYRDRDFFKQSSKIFAGVFLPLLLLLFVTIPKNEDVKEEIAVVYKIPQPEIKKPQEDQIKSELKAEELTSKTENSGHKENSNPSQKVEFSAASAQQKQIAKNTSPQPAAAQPVATTPVKSYEFKTNVAFNSIVGDAPQVNTQGAKSRQAMKDSSFNVGSSDQGALVSGADIGVSKFNGSDKKGSGQASYGSRGLASKSGFDSAYLEPKTVVLGSMDPELLRKILREYIPQFRHCYQQELITNSDKIKGIIDLNFSIDANGKVAKYNIKTKDAQFSQKGVGCMGSVLSIIDFPKPKGGGVVDVRQPLNFFSETEKI